MPVSYRRLAPNDSEMYRRIRLESLKAHPESYGTNYEEQKQLPKLKLEKAIEQPVDESFVIGAFDQGDLIGICGFIPFVPQDLLNLGNAGTLIQMYVRSSYSGRKIGLKLTLATIREAFEVSAIDQIVLGVQEGNIPAIRVYEQAGFRRFHSEGSSGETVNRGFRMMIIDRDQLI